MKPYTPHKCEECGKVAHYQIASSYWCFSCGPKAEVFRRVFVGTAMGRPDEAHS